MRGIGQLLGSTAVGAGLFIIGGALAGPAHSGELSLVSGAGSSPGTPVPMAYAPPNMPAAASQTWHLDMIGATVAYGRGYTGASVTVAVADSGFDITHPALAGKLDLARAYSTLYVAGETYDPKWVDIQLAGDVHGTHVSGIIAGRKDPSLWDSHGVAYDATIVPIRTIFDNDVLDKDLGTYVTSGPPDAIDYFTSLANVKVMNASFGPGVDRDSPPLLQWNVSPGTMDEAMAVWRALAADKIIVAATGNDRKKNPVAGLNPSGIALYPFIRPEHAGLGVYNDYGTNLNYSGLLYQPGQVIGVMSVGPNKQAAYYSNLCGVTASWCVAAPGGDQTAGASDGVFSTVPRGEYNYLQGTSMATPVVTGALAVLISAYPDYSARDLAQVLFSTTENIGKPGINAMYGQGLIRLDRATDGPTTLQANETVALAGGTTYWSQPLTTSGAFTKTGDGILTIAGRTTAPGEVRVSGGTLAVDGTLSVVGDGHALIVDQTGTLAGMGVINANTTIAGLLSPGKMANVQDLLNFGSITNAAEVVGNSAGQLNFTGNVTLATTATTRIDIDGGNLVPGGPGTHDRIFVGGAGNIFTVGGALTPVLRGSVGTPSNYTPSIGEQFRFVEAYGGAHIAGSFSSMVQPTSGLPAQGRFDLIYGPTSLMLSVTPQTFAGLNGGGLTTSQRDIAGILDSRRPDAGVLPDPTVKALYDALYALTSPASYGTAMTQLSAPGQPAATSAGMTAFTGFMGSIADRQNALQSGAAVVQSATAQSFAFASIGRSISSEARQATDAFASLDREPVVADGRSVWGQAFGRWNSVGEAGGLAGSSTRSGGFALGVDQWLADDLTGGVAVGFARTTTGSGDLTATSDTYTGAIYGSWTPGRAVIDLRASAGPSQTQTTRMTMLSPATIDGRANGVGGSVGIEAGYIIPFGPFVAKPFAGVTWQGFHRNGYAETQQPIGLVYPAQSFDKLTTTFGVALSGQFRSTAGLTFAPELKLGWGHDWRDTTLVSQAALLDSAFTVTAASPGREAALVGVKLAGWQRENLRLFAAYNGEFRSNAVSHQFTGGVRVAW